jgi:hypothetical protein
MSKYQHRTNLTNNTSPSTSEIEFGEIGINSTSLGTAANGFNNGRLYIKLANGEVRRFIGLGLPGTSDPALKTKYGGTNNDFSSVSAPTVANNKPLLYFNYNANTNHTIDKTDNDTLTWDTANSRLKVGGAAGVAAGATLDVRGDVRIDTVASASATFVSTSRIIGWDTSARTLSAIDAPDFFTYFPSSSIPVSKISGTISLANGGTNINFGGLGVNDGSVVFYDSTNSRFYGSSRFKWDNSGYVLNINGGISTTGVISTTSYFENNVPSEASTNAVPIGVDGSNKIVRLSSSNSSNLSFTTIQVSGGGNVVADSNTDTLILNAGAGISLSVDSASDTITITNTGAGGTSYPSVTVTGINADRTLTSTSDKYQFINPSGSNRNVILSISSMTEGQEFLINNLDNTYAYTLSVYNSGTAGTLLSTLTGTSSPSGGLFVFDGTQWRTALLS